MPSGRGLVPSRDIIVGCDFPEWGWTGEAKARPGEVSEVVLGMDNVREAPCGLLFEWWWWDEGFEAW